MRIHMICLLCFGLSDTLLAQTAPIIAVSEEGSAWRIKVEARLAVSPKQLWAALTDCNQARDFIPHFESCRILEKESAGKWDIRENISNPPFLPRNRTIIRSVYRAPNGFSYKLVSGDMKQSEGAWELTPQKDATLLNYSALFEPLISIPAFMIVPALKKDLADMFQKLEAAAISRP